MASASPPDQSADPQWHYTGSLDEKDFALHGHGTVVLLTTLCILLVVTLLYLYLRWICYSNSFAASDAGSTENAVTGTPDRANNHASSGLDVEVIKSLPVELHKEGESTRECVICLGAFITGEKVKVLPSCSHGFHPECIDGWLRTQPNCPLCRASVVKISIADVKDLVKICECSSPDLLHCAAHSVSRWIVLRSVLARISRKSNG